MFSRALVVLVAISASVLPVEAATLLKQRSSVQEDAAQTVQVAPGDVTESTEGPIRTIEGEGWATKSDITGKGAVLCLWSIYAGVQYTTRKCGWTRLAVDDAIDQAVVDIDQFIIDNMPVPVTQAQLDEMKRKDNDWLWGGSAASIAKMCAVEDVNEGGPAAFAWQYRSNSDAESLRAGVADLLSIPREPVMNPCL